VLGDRASVRTGEARDKLVIVAAIDIAIIIEVAEVNAYNGA
jgi:hypothetical protein